MVRTMVPRTNNQKNITRSTNIGGKKMDKKEIIMLVFIGLLVLTAAIQTIQLTTLRNSAGSMNMPMTMTKASATSSSASSSNLDNLPEMVGGC